MEYEKGLVYGSVYGWAKVYEKECGSQYEKACGWEMAYGLG